MNNFKNLFTKSIAMLLAVIMVFGMIPMPAYAVTSGNWLDVAADSYADGTGTAEDPYQIATAEQLAKLAKDSTDKTIWDNFILTEDIVLTGKYWTPIGSDGTTGETIRNFRGTFDGQGNTITDLTMSSTEDTSIANLQSVGLFAKLYYATVKDINFTNVDIDIASTATMNVGTLAGFAEESQIKDITVGTSTDSSAVRGERSVGGIVGQIDSVLVTNCTNYADVTNRTSYTNSHDQGNIGDEKGGHFTGGLVGYSSDSGSTISYSHNKGDILTEVVKPSYPVYTGGILGGSSYIQYVWGSGNIEQNNISINNSSNSGMIQVTQTGTVTSNVALFTGGILGRGNDTNYGSGGGFNSTVKNVFNEGNIEVVAEANIQFINRQIGSISGRATVTNAYNKGDIAITHNNASINATDIGAISGHAGNIYHSYWSNASNKARIAGYNNSSNSEAVNSATFVQSGVLTAYTQNIEEYTGIIGNNTTLLGALNEFVDTYSTASSPLLAWIGTGSDIKFIEPVTLSGTVQDQNGNLSGAKITLSNGESITTGADGKYSFSGLYPGGYSLTISKEGYLTTPYGVVVGNENTAADTVKILKIQAFTNNTINNREQLAYLSEQVNKDTDPNNYRNETIVLGANIDLTGFNWSPIGFRNEFAGVFDGNDKTITGLTVKVIDDEAGLFGNITSITVKEGYDEMTGTLTEESIGMAGVHDLIIEDAKIYNAAVVRLSSEGGALVGSLRTEGGTMTIENVDVVGGMIEAGDAGGVIGYINNSVATVQDVTNSATVNSTYNAGGIIGNVVSSNTLIKNVKNTGAISSVQNVGGIVGVNDGRIANAENTGDVNSEVAAGGIAGYNSGFITNSENTGTVIGVTAGGLVGNQRNILSNSVNKGTVKNIDTTYASSIGGLVGKFSEGTIYNNYSIGSIENVEDRAHVGGLVGSLGGTPIFGGQSASSTYMYNNYSVPSSFTLGNAENVKSGLIAVGSVGYNGDASNVTVTHNYALANDSYTAFDSDFTENATLRENTIASNGTFTDSTDALKMTEPTDTAIAPTLLTALNTFIVSDNAPTDISGNNWIVTAGTNGGYPYLAPPVELSGTLKDQDNANISGVTVELRSIPTSSNAVEEIKFTDTTAADGTYALSDVETGVYILQADKDGYRLSRQYIQITSDMTENIDLIRIDDITKSGGSYTIDSLGEFAGYAEKVEANEILPTDNITLTTNLDLSRYYWDPIGAKPSKSTTPIGQFDGGNKTITGLTINSVDDDQGLFGELNRKNDYDDETSDMGSISNLTLTNVDVYTTGEDVGALIGDVEIIDDDAIGADVPLRLENIAVNGEVEGESNVGGFIGKTSNLNANNLSGTIKVTSENYAGGFVGYMRSILDIETVITDATLNVTVKSDKTNTSAYTGGLIGRIYESDRQIIENITIDGSVEGYYAGGILGYAEKVSANDVTNNATVTGHSAAGFSPRISTGGTSPSYEDRVPDNIIQGFTNNGAITGEYGAYGFGTFGFSRIMNSVNNADVEISGEDAQIAAGMGVFYNKTEVYNNINKGDVTSTRNAYGIGTISTAEIWAAKVANNYTTGSVTSTTENQYDIVNLTVGVESGVDHDDNGNVNYYLSSLTGDVSNNTSDATPDQPFTGNGIVDALNAWVKANYTNETRYASWLNGTTYPEFAIPATAVFAGNGSTSGTVPTVSQAGLYKGGTVIAPGNTGNLARPGYNFAGWALSATNPSTIYQQGEQIPLNNSDNTIYAVWSRGIEAALVELESDYTYTGSPIDVQYDIKVDGDTISENVGYEVVKINKKGEQTAITEIVDATTYEITIKGIGAYSGQKTLDLVTVAQKALNVVDDEFVIEKVYDATAKIVNGPTEIASDAVDAGITIEITDISSYESKNVGNYEVDLTLGDIKGEKAANYKLTTNEHIFAGAKITKFVVASAEPSSDMVLTKAYDGTTSAPTASGKIILKDASGIEAPDDASINFTIGEYTDANIGKDKTIRLTFTTLTDRTNYELTDNFDNIHDFTTAQITPSPFGVEVSDRLEVGKSSTVDTVMDLVDVIVEGLGDDVLTGELDLYVDEDHTTALKDEDIAGFEVNSENTVYYLFTLDTTNPDNANYETESMSGSIVIVKLATDPQTIVWSKNQNVINTTYGDIATEMTATVTEADGGAIVYSSSDETVATVDPSSGAVTIIGVGKTDITATASPVEGKYHATSKTYALNVQPKELTIQGLTATDRKFDGTDVVALAGGTLTGIVGDDDVTVTIPTEGMMANINADVDKAVFIGAVELMGTDANNYTLKQTTESTVTISKADAPETITINKSLPYDEAQTSVRVPLAGLPDNRGTTTYDVVSVTSSTAILATATSPTAIGGVLEFSTNAGNDGDTDAITVTAYMQNYEDATIVVNVILVDKTEVTIDGITVANKVYDGRPISYAGEATNAQGYTGDYEYIWSTSDRNAPTEAGTYTLTIKVPDANEDFMGEHIIENIVISKKDLTVKPKGQSIYNGEALPTSFEFEYVGIVEEDSITHIGTPTYEIQDEDGNIIVNSNTNDTYVIKWTNKDDVTINDNNYNITKSDGKLTITNKPVAPSGGGGSSSSEEELEDENTDIMISADDAKGLTVDEISQNDDVYEELMEAVDEGYTVIGAFEIKVEEHNGELRITFPVDSSYNGKKFVVIHKLSSGEIEKYTGTVINGKVVITVDELSPFMIAVEGDALVNPFVDVMINNWFYEAVMYTIENGLFSGTSEDMFSPNTAMTRAMMWTVLARMDGEDTTGGDMWYTKGMEWSMTNGISDGTTPDTNITREQLATMMYRYAQMKDYDMTKTAELSIFTDGADVSTWAMKEMQWAVGSGLISGKGNDMLDPMGEATRAEVATVLMRFVEMFTN